MATQGTTKDFMELLLAMKKDEETFSQPGKILFLVNQFGNYQKTIGIIIDNPNGDI